MLREERSIAQARTHDKYRSSIALRRQHVEAGCGDTIPIAVAHEAIASCPRPGAGPGSGGNGKPGSVRGHVFDFGHETRSGSRNDDNAGPLGGASI